MREFHISRQSRDRYQFDESIFTFSGNAILANFHAARLLAQKMNQKRDLVTYPEQTVKAGQINALGLIDEILHYVVFLYRRQKAPQVMEEALVWLEGVMGVEQVERVLLEFGTEFPPLRVYRKEISLGEYMDGETDGVSNRAVMLEELILLWVTNKNPAAEPYQELFDDSRLSDNSAYARLMGALQQFFDTRPRFGPDQQNLLDMLRAPAIAVPSSLSGQLEFIRSRWSELLGRYLYRLLSSLDLIQEEERARFFGPGPVTIPVYDPALLAGAGEAEAFSPDREWMPNLVLIAKNTYVWLDQLSRRFKRPVNRLDQIPDEALDELSRWGITGLWLIGLWERSRASARIKQLCGNPEAVASAYSLDSYQIAADLGGEDAYRNLRDRAWQRGIRLASDMVPNHMGIDSTWVKERPDYFLGLPYSPFPGYSFNGPNLSDDPNLGIYIEDHYYDRTDAAVVFKRVDFRSGDTRYIYHGNDGTSMPWNDTAQLDYLNPQVREAVIQTILEVARRFPIIRFDAAMTLAKKHVQRLWYPEPGSGGAIPSRSDFAMTREQFDQAMPIEFWREVVDRCAVEAPDTLLLAEAFWLMESYFVRTLGMHRVYNSAFMNMLRNEDNAGYRKIMKNTLEFDAEILKRFVNFMNNPDERTAVDQFGKGDKYFAICVLMVTLPGLPMLGHGQVEGFAEKYGMEFRRAYWDEQPDGDLIARHEKEIFPLLKKRYLFAGVDRFRLYDFQAAYGTVEDVYAYTNAAGGERCLVVVNNRYAEYEGWIHHSCISAVRQAGEKRPVSETLGQALELNGGPNTFCIFRDVISGWEFIRPSREVRERGLHLRLRAYQAHVFTDFQEVEDDPSGSYRRLCDTLGGRGVPSIRESLRDLVLQPIIQPFIQIANPGYFRYLLENPLAERQTALPPAAAEEMTAKLNAWYDGIQWLNPELNQRAAALEQTRLAVEAILSLDHLEKRPAYLRAPKAAELITRLRASLLTLPESRPTLLAFAFTHAAGLLGGEADAALRALSWLDEWQLTRPLQETFSALGLDDGQRWRAFNTLQLLISQQGWSRGQLDALQQMQAWLGQPETQSYLGVNRYQDVLWFNHESFLTFTDWMCLLAILENESARGVSAALRMERILYLSELNSALKLAESESGYKVEGLLNALSKPQKPGKAKTSAKKQAAEISARKRSQS